MSAIPLHRLGRPVQSFLSVLGQVRETRLTATLAFLMSRFPEEFLPLIWGRRFADVSISVEETAEGDRYDVLVKGGRFPVILEGKTGFCQNSAQLLRYVHNVRRLYGRRPELVVVDTGSGRAQGLSDESDSVRKQVAGIRRITWTQIAAVCRGIVRRRGSFKRDRVAAAVAEDLLTHLEENQMTTEERPEIYLRELSSTPTVNLYFRYGIYKSQAKFLKSAQPNLYFAPYFTARTAENLSESNLVPIGQGISYISRIKQVQVVPAKKVLEFLKANGVEDARTAAELVRKGHGGGDVLILLLGKPRLLFASPVTKAKLGRVETRKKFTKGTLGARSCSLDELLAASNA
jgi:hypothetical protein